MEEDMKKKKTHDKSVENHEGDTNCSKNPMHVEIENACSCRDEDNKIHTIPDEYFYNSCDCVTCETQNYDEYSTDSEILCSCGYMGNPLGMSMSDCSCNY